MQTERCFHCAEPNPVQAPSMQINGELQFFCCHGCMAVASFIDASGLQSFYDLRTDSPHRAGFADAAKFDLSAFDRPSFQKVFVDADSETGVSTARLTIDGVNCGACSWLIRKSLLAISGVEQVDVNPATGWATVEFKHSEVLLSHIVDQIARLGYQPSPANDDEQTSRWLKLRRNSLARLAVAGFGMMQVMTYAVAMYAGAFTGIDQDTRYFLRLVSLLVTTPVVFYSAAPFFAQATSALRHRAMSMDVPVALAIALAYLTSVVNTFSRSGEVYFDSIVMFVFLLSMARFLVGGINQRSRTDGLSIDSLTPSLARRFESDSVVAVGVDELQVDDRVLVGSGELVPVDGVLAEGSGKAQLQQAWLSGESRVVTVGPSEPVLAGSRNVGGPLDLVVTAVGEQRSVSQIRSLYQRALGKRPPSIKQADRLASWFVAIVLILAVAGGLAWTVAADYQKGVEIALAVLIVSCPCALSLATPAVLAAASGGLIRHGILLADGAAIENLKRVDKIVFDKTGSLTRGQLSLKAIHTAPDGCSGWLKTVVASLEQRSNHPIATALRGLAEPVAVDQWQDYPGDGLSGVIAGHRYWLGRHKFVSTQAPETDLSWAPRGDDAVWIGDDQGVLGCIELTDAPRAGCRQVVDYFASKGSEICLLSGDSEAIVDDFADLIGIDEHYARQSPQDKLEKISSWQNTQRLLFVGDGVNDAPAMAQADVSVALGSGSAMAKSGADIVLLSDRLDDLLVLDRAAQRARALIRQNLWWAGGYNLVIIPVTLAGMVPPWLAAVGMSVSSLAVVLSSLRGRRI
ncbi:MAG: copper-translocating P-type ATPase [Lysobacteraceae bacterium]|nr:MAG: copper-translocating P-type ATPase [Xanthomonadaceae bacterium]